MTLGIPVCWKDLAWEKLLCPAEVLSMPSLLGGYLGLADGGLAGC